MMTVTSLMNYDGVAVIASLEGGKYLAMLAEEQPYWYLVGSTTPEVLTKMLADEIPVCEVFRPPFYTWTGIEGDPLLDFNGTPEDYLPDPGVYWTKAL